MTKPNFWVIAILQVVMVTEMPINQNYGLNIKVNEVFFDEEFRA